MNNTLKKYTEDLTTFSEKNLILKMVEMGVKIEVLSPIDKLLRIKFKNKKTLLMSNKLDFDTLSKIRISRNKNATKYLLNKSSLKTPKGITVSLNSEIEKEIEKEKIKFPVVFKPLTGSDSRNVFIDIQNIQELRKILQKNSFNKKELFVVEEFYPGNNFRVLILKNKFIACVQRTAANITGDGKKTIEELIAQKNKKNIKGHEIKIDEKLLENIKKQGYKRNSILKKEQRIFLRKIESVSTGGDSIDKTSEISPYFKKIAIKAVKSIGLKRAGVDILTNDISGKNCDYRILEINAKPGLTIHEKPVVIGKTHKVTEKFIKAYFKDQRK